MKILFVIATLGSGGAERVMTTLANRLSAEHEVAIATFWNDEPFYPLDKRVEYIRLDIMRQTYGWFEKIRYLIKRVRTLRSLLKEYDPDIVISFLTETNVTATIAAKLAKKPIIISERSSFFALRLRYIRIARYLVYPFADCLITQTEADRKNYTFVPRTKVIANPVSFTNCPDEVKEHIVLGVGRLEEPKRFEDLIEAFVSLGRSDWRLFIAGEGSKRALLESLIERYKADNISLLGRRKDVEKLYAKAAIFVMPSMYEGFPNALLEAMVCGCACVSYDCNYGPSEMLGTDRGILVEMGDKKGLAQAIESLMRDEKMRQQMAERAKVYARREFHIDTIAKKWEETIQAVVQRKCS